MTALTCDLNPAQNQDSYLSIDVVQRVIYYINSTLGNQQFLLSIDERPRCKHRTSCNANKSLH